MSHPAVSVSFGDVSGELPSRAQIQAWVDNALAELRPGAGLDLKVVDEAEMRRLNARFRGRDRATNVLAFPAEPLPGADWDHLGDIVIAAPLVDREAREYGIATADRWAHLITHAVLHLLGYEHEQAADAERMETEEIRLLARLGIDNPYS